MASSYSLADFEIGNALGSGQFGKVFLARERHRGAIVALKLMSIMDICALNMRQQIRREIEIQASLNHPNLVRLYGYFIHGDFLCLVMEPAAHEVFKMLRKCGRFDEETARRVIVGVAAAIEHMHGRGVMHRDIKPENVLLDHLGNVKVTDFGWAVQTSLARRDTICGTLDYLSPEMIQGEPHDARVDLWALGVLAYELLVGCSPFAAEEDLQVIRNIAKAKIAFPEHVSTGAKDFIAQLLQGNPADRLAIAKVLGHPWIDLKTAPRGYVGGVKRGLRARTVIQGRHAFDEHALGRSPHSRAAALSNRLSGVSPR